MPNSHTVQDFFLSINRIREVYWCPDTDSWVLVHISRLNQRRSHAWSWQGLVLTFLLPSSYYSAGSPLHWMRKGGFPGFFIQMDKKFLNVDSYSAGSERSANQTASQFYIRCMLKSATVPLQISSLSPFSKCWSERIASQKLKYPVWVLVLGEHCYNFGQLPILCFGGS